MIQVNCLLIKFTWFDVGMWKRIRVTILLLILAYVSLTSYLDLQQNWDDETIIVVHPVNAQKDEFVEQYIKSLKPSDFDDITEFLTKNATQYRKKDTSIRVVLGSTLKTPPPIVDEKVAANIFTTGLWSLKFKFYALRNMRKEDFNSDTAMYLNYYYSKNVDQLERSTALQRGRIGLVNLYGEKVMTPTNNVIIAHEALHTFGAEDYYDLSTGIPIFPIGYADPDQKPLYPQKRAEIMGGYILINEQDFTIPNGFDEVVLKKDTAKSLKWIE